MTIKCYKSYGVLAHELQPVYNLYAHEEIFDEIKIEVPGAYEDTDGFCLIDLNGETYSVNRILHNDKFGNPILAWTDYQMNKHVMRLKVVE